MNEHLGAFFDATARDPEALRNSSIQSATINVENRERNKDSVALYGFKEGATRDSRHTL